MSDWRSHIDGEPGVTGDPRLRRTGVHVEEVLRLLRDGATVEQVRTRFQGLGEDEVRACLDYAVALLDRAKFYAEIRRRIAEDEADPDEGMEHEEFMRRLREDDWDDE